MSLSRFTFRGVTYRYNEEAEGSAFRHDKGIGNARLTTTYRVPWYQRQIAQDNLIGKTVFVPSPTATFGWFSRTLPHSHPEGAMNGADLQYDGPSNSWIWCKRADYVGHIRESAYSHEGAPGHIDALLSCTYEGLPYYNLLDSVMDSSEGGVSIPIDEATLKRFVSHPTPEDKCRLKEEKGGTWKFVDRGTVLPSSTFTRLVEECHQFRWHQVIKVNIPYPAIAAAKFGCNHQTFAGFPAESLVFSKYSIQELPRLQDGTMGVDVIYYMDYYPMGANFYPDPARGGRYFRVISQDGSRRPYELVNFRTLFRPILGPAGVVV